MHEHDMTPIWIGHAVTRRAAMKAVDVVTNTMIDLQANIRYLG